jgi:hypothetical protein
MAMKLWIFTPAAALGAALFLIFASPVALNDADAPCIKVAALQSPEVMSDACVFSAEAMAAGETGSCSATVDQSSSFSQPFTWPGDFINLTVMAAAEIWNATLHVIVRMYTYAAVLSGLAG